MGAQCVESAQVLDLEEDNLGEEEDAEDEELEGIDVGEWERKNGLRLVLVENEWEVL